MRLRRKRKQNIKSLNIWQYRFCSAGCEFATPDASFLTWMRNAFDWIEYGTKQRETFNNFDELGFRFGRRKKIFATSHIFSSFSSSSSSSSWFSSDRVLFHLGSNQFHHQASCHRRPLLIRRWRIRRWQRQRQEFRHDFQSHHRIDERLRVILQDSVGDVFDIAQVDGMAGRIGGWRRSRPICRFRLCVDFIEGRVWVVMWYFCDVGIFVVFFRFRRLTGGRRGRRGKSCKEGEMKMMFSSFSHSYSDLYDGPYVRTFHQLMIGLWDWKKKWPFDRQLNPLYVWVLHIAKVRSILSPYWGNIEE